MPKADRNKKQVAKELEKAAAKPGQAKITSIFSHQSISKGEFRETDQPALSPSSVGTSEKITSKPDDTSSLTEAWVKRKDDFTSNDRAGSERSGRYFHADWFAAFEWLAYNRDRKKAFCSVCTSHSQSRKGNFNFKYGEGFDNWKKGQDKMKEHEKSQTHKAAVCAMEKSNLSIASTVTSLKLEKQNLRMQGLISHLHTLKTLLRQGVSIRGDTDEDSNIYQFNLDKAVTDSGLKLLLKEKHYVLAHDILEEQKQMLVLEARRDLLERIRQCEFFSILADESSDVTKKEQLSFSIRTCNDQYEVSEDFIGIFECSQGLTSDALLSYIEDILLRCHLNGAQMAGMGFDGAAAMKSLARKMKEKVAPNAIYIHCFAHCNELVVKDAIKESTLLSSSLELCQSLYAIVGAYPKRIQVFEDIQKAFMTEQVTNEYNILRLQSLSATRWTTRVKAANTIFEKTAEIRETLQSLTTDQSISRDTKARIQHLLKHKMSSLGTLFGLNATRRLLALLEKFSKELQSITISADYAFYSLRYIVQRLQEMRCMEHFNIILEESQKIVEACEKSDEVRPRKVPRRMEGESIILTERLPATSTDGITCNDNLRRSFFEAIDAISSSLEQRFEQEDLSTLKQIEEVLLKSMKNRGVDLAILQCGFLDKEMVETQLDDLPTILGLYNAERELKITNVTRIGTVEDIFNAMPSAKLQCPEVHRMIKLYKTVPLSSSTCERSFSAMRRLKTWLRAKAKANHLNDIMFAHIQKTDFDKLDINLVAKKFVQRNDQRKDYFGK